MNIVCSYSFLVPDYVKAKKAHRLEGHKTLVMILAQGSPDKKAFKDISPKYSMFYKWMGFEKSECIHACGVMEFRDLKNQEIFCYLKLDAQVFFRAKHSKLLSFRAQRSRDPGTE